MSFRRLKFLLPATLTAAAFAQVSARSISSHQGARPAPVPPAPTAVLQGLPLASVAGLGPHQHRGTQHLPFFPISLFSEEWLGEKPATATPAQATPYDLLQILAALSQTRESEMPKPEPLLIELRGNRYVQVSGGARGADQALVEAASAQAGKKSASADVLAPVTLVFRDGRREDVRDYTIAGGVMYVRGDISRDGFWNKKIGLAELNLPETFQANKDRGAGFVLPRADNEVVTRP